jgi:hypothetical protein
MTYFEGGHGMWYVGLALVSVLPATWTLWQRRDAVLVSVFFVAAALIAEADWIMNGWFRLYEYHPGLMREPIGDASLGVILAEILFVGSFCVLLVAYLPRWVGIILGTATVTVLHVLFTNFGLLTLHGWTVWLNVMGFMAYFWAIYALSHVVAQKGLTSEWTLSVSRTGVVAVFSGLMALTERISKAVQTQIYLLPTASGNQSLGRFLWHVAVTMPLGYWIVAGGRSGRLERLGMATLISGGLNYALTATHLRIFRAPWNPMVDALFQGVMLYGACLVDDWIQGWAKEPRTVHLR